MDRTQHPGYGMAPMQPTQEIEVEQFDPTIATIRIERASYGSIRERAKLRVITETRGDLSAAEIEGIHLIAKAAELGASGGPTREEIGERLERIVRQLGGSHSSEPFGETTVHAILEAQAGTLFGILRELTAIRERRVRRATQRDAGKAKAAKP